MKRRAFLSALGGGAAVAAAGEATGEAASWEPQSGEPTRDSQNFDIWHGRAAHEPSVRIHTSHPASSAVWDGRAVDSDQMIGEDLSDIVRLLVPSEAPILSRLPKPNASVAGTIHQWTEDGGRYANVTETFKLPVPALTQPARDYQTTAQTAALLRELETAVIGIPEDAGYVVVETDRNRCMRSLQAMIPLRRVPHAQLMADPLAMINAAIRDSGADDLDMLLTGTNLRMMLCSTGALRARGGPRGVGYSGWVHTEAAGILPVFASTRLPAFGFMVLASRRILVAPLQGRSFQYQQLATERGHVIGDYTLEVARPEAHAYVRAESV